MKLNQLKEGILDKPSPKPTTIGEAIKRSGKQVTTLGNDVIYHGLLNFDFPMLSVVSWEGCPTIFRKGSGSSTNGGLSLANLGISTLEGMLVKEAGTILLSNNQLTNLHHIHKHILSANIIFIPEDAINLLGLFFIKNIEHIYVTGRNGDVSASQRGRNLESILKTHLPTKDINACQEELIAAGFAPQARL